MKNNTNMVWVFSFADLAFLLVMALAVLPTADSDYKNLKLSKINNNPTTTQSTVSKQQYRLYVDKGSTPVDSIRIEEFRGQKWMDTTEFKSIADIKNKLKEIKREKKQLGFLANQDSNTGNLLQALALLQEVWPQRDIWTTIRTKFNDKNLK